MTGLDKIVKQIQDEARQAADRLLSEANAEAQQITEKAKSDAAAQTAATRAQSAIDVNNQLAAAESAAELTRRRAILAAKQEIIAEVIDGAEQEIYALPDADYFDLILKMIHKYSLSQAGEILFSKKDYARIPSGFEDKLKAAANGPLTLSQETRAIAGGFVLTYGGIEENCTIHALFGAAHEQLQDKVQEILFS